MYTQGKDGRTEFCISQGNALLHCPFKFARSSSAAPSPCRRGRAPGGGGHVAPRTLPSSSRIAVKSLPQSTITAGALHEFLDELDPPMGFGKAHKASDYEM